MNNGRTLLELGAAFSPAAKTWWGSDRSVGPLRAEEFQIGFRTFFDYYHLFAQSGVDMYILDNTLESIDDLNICIKKEIPSHIEIVLNNDITGACGNDLAIDDIKIISHISY